MTTKTRVLTVTCPQCHVEMYSRANHDFRACDCGTFIDGGFSCTRISGPAGYSRPRTRFRYVNATKQELYDDWNKGTDRFGVII